MELSAALAVYKFLPTSEYANFSHVIQTNKQTTVCECTCVCERCTLYILERALIKRTRLLLLKIIIVITLLVFFRLIHKIIIMGANKQPVQRRKAEQERKTERLACEICAHTKEP